MKKHYFSNVPDHTCPSRSAILNSFPTMQCAKAQLVANITTINPKIPFLNPQFLGLKGSFTLSSYIEIILKPLIFKVTKEKIRKILNYGILLRPMVPTIYN